MPLIQIIDENWKTITTTNNDCDWIEIIYVYK